MNCPEIVTDELRLKTIVDSARDHRHVALDLESNGFHRYPERICLVQIAFADRVFLVDPLAIDDVGQLGVLLSSPGPEKIFHSADYDIRSLHRDWSFAVFPLFDTSIAAAFVGHRNLGLHSLLKECLNIEITKTKRLQRADWTVRPITTELREYAAGDVRYLERLASLLGEQLDILGRAEWVAEECQRITSVRFSQVDREHAFLSVKGSRDLNGQSLAVLRSLYNFREREAIERDRPPFKILSNSTLIFLASNPETDLRSMKGIGPYAFGSRARRLRNALESGVNADPIESRMPRSERRVRLSPMERNSARKRLAVLKQWRNEHAVEMDIQVGLVWSAKSLERISADPSRFEDELNDDSVRRWQKSELAGSLYSLVRSL